MTTDLDGDDIKVVRYTIAFVKPGAETVLQAERDVVVDNATSQSEFAGMKVAEFLQRVHQHGIPWPSAWRHRPSNQYPEVGQPITEIPEDDRE